MSKIATDCKNREIQPCLYLLILGYSWYRSVFREPWEVNVHSGGDMVKSFSQQKGEGTVLATDSYLFPDVMYSLLIP